MGWHYILRFKCTILPEYREFIEKRYLDDLFDSDLDIDYIEKPQRYYDSDPDKDAKNKKIYEEWLKEEEEEQKERERVYEGLSKFYKDLIDIWTHLKIGSHFYKYELKDNKLDLEQSSRPNEPGLKSQIDFECEISKKVNWHNGPSGNLREDYETFLKDIIVPLTSRIDWCEIESDDYGDMRWYYTDTELRGIPFSLENKIKSIQHIYNEDKTEIIGSHVIYKHSIPKHQFRDLDRSYGIRE